MLEKIVESCQFLLDNFPEAQASKSYLDSRLNQESQKKWGFGYFPNINNLSALTDLIGEEALIESELLTSGQVEDAMSPRRVMRDFFEDHPLIMPQRDAYGKVVALVGRTLLPESAYQAKKVGKYKNTSFKKRNHLFGLYENRQNILDSGCVYIVEGQFDVIKASEAGLKNVVALGNSTMGVYQFFVINRYSNNIRLLLDNDIAGQKGRKLIISKFGHLANIKNFYIPLQYKDVDEYITKANISDYTGMSFSINEE